MTAMVSNQQTAVQPIKTGQLVATFKAIAPRSFEKTFEGMPAEAINHAMKICVEDLSREQITTGLRMVRDNGFCPDPAMFRKWCLGITGFGTEQQRVVDSFKGKHAALGDIVKWLGDNTHAITNAEKEAYDRCYEMFSDIQWAKNVDRASYLAYEAFKDNYVDVVKEYAEQGQQQAIWEQPVGIEDKKQADLYRPVPKSYLPKQSPEAKVWIDQRAKELEEKGLSVIRALMQATQECPAEFKEAV
ncbi:hypothetical protein HCY65_10835 [Acinetobacter radioresistens]|uniref:Uncharacterized protein n=1 Tax=Acinetobacter radioresistens SK82 TaxID=596318 RepID=A0ABM9YPC9_ACIRA|nr:hypothetical protein [Acinetobacter radioresistens]EET82832.1 hypothetical protein ACIRA0001_1626 [Acinetobacter radioresistens SK82]MCK4097551.1 hypothetical protein [Acinetobacter radioresistens]MCK4111550.1 hypothetical protein [Acinetobacter radioresistens]QMU05613.1 hypothetical protein FOC39_01530 [Acinetobacter radioresistens]